MADWYVGQKIIRVSNSGSARHGFETIPVVGQVYTIRDIQLHPWAKYEVFFLLDEIVNKEAVYGGLTCEYRFGSSNFRPICTTKLDCFSEVQQSHGVSAKKREPELV
jgi:hypothetical protein